MSEVIMLDRPVRTIMDLRRYRLCFLGTPYRKFPSGRQRAYEEACKLAARLSINGVNVFSPIAHSHGLSMYGDINPIDNSFWLARNKPFMFASDAFLIGKLETWESSDGLKDEIEEFYMQGKPSYYIEPNSLLIRSAT